jgi:uncharacterized protein YhhL (DUF1145 family)
MSFINNVKRYISVNGRVNGFIKRRHGFQFPWGLRQIIVWVYFFILILLFFLTTPYAYPLTGCITFIIITFLLMSGMIGFLIAATISDPTEMNVLQQNNPPILDILSSSYMKFCPKCNTYVFVS